MIHTPANLGGQTPKQSWKIKNNIVIHVKDVGDVMYWM